METGGRHKNTNSNSHKNTNIETNKYYMNDHFSSVWWAEEGERKAGDRIIFGLYQ